MPTIALTPIALCREDNEVTHTLRERGYELKLHPKSTLPTREEQRALLSDAVGIIASSEPITREVMQEAPNLRFISRYGVGYDNIDCDAATDLGILVTYVPDAMTEAVADLTMALLLAVARRLPELDGLMKAGEWKRLMAADVTGRTLGLVGTGRIGIATARRARGFGMRLLGYDPYPNPLFLEELGGSYVSLDELLESSDFVSLHLPATVETHALIGGDQLLRMKRSAFLINCARGSVVDEQALVEALNEGEIAGAATDVFSVEPPLADSAGAALARHPKVVATPHVASMTPLTVAKMGRVALANLLDALDGRRPQHVCNPEVYDRGLRS
jgi:phosphoglycerate dehydrogenase-like enzyme